MIQARSQIAQGWVRHRRLYPFERVFKHQVTYFWVDLDEAPRLFYIPGLFSYNRPGLISFNHKHLYTQGKSSDLQATLRDRIEQDLGFRPLGSIRVLTQLSYLGYGFNPVSFYYFSSLEGETEAVLAEITNTPWSERHAYAVDLREKKKSVFKKEFHVSPFLGMDYRYHWNFGESAHSLQIHMDNFSTTDLAKHFDATLSLELKPWTRFNVLMALVRQPLMTFKTAFLIYAHAGILWVRRTPFFDHPPKQLPPADPASGTGDPP